MDLDNINDIEVLREAAKYMRVQLNEDVADNTGHYIFKKGFWYIMEQDDYYVTICSDNYAYTRTLSYKEAGKCFNICD